MKKCNVCGKPAMPSNKHCAACYRIKIKITIQLNPEKYYKTGYRYPDAYQAIASLKLGRDLYVDEVVHHIDGDPTNNNPYNLLVCSVDEHMRLHGKKTTARREAEFEAAEVERVRTIRKLRAKLAKAKSKGYAQERIIEILTRDVDPSQK